MTLYFDKLIDRYIPTDSGWNFHPENTALLPSTEIDGKLVIEATNPLPTDYKQLMYSNVSSGGNATVYYLDMITSKDSGTLPEIVKDSAASNARAIKLAPETTMIFRTNYPYNKDRLKKVLCRCRKEAGAPALHVGVIGIEDKAYKQPDGTCGNDTFYEVTVSGEITETYVTYVGYIAGTDTAENIELVSRPNNNPDYPAKLLDGTTDIALMIRTGNGTGSIYIDSIELQDTENALTELPKGAMVVNSLEGLTDDNKLSPVEKTYIKTLMTEIDAEYTGILADGTAAGVSSTLLTALTTKYNALHSVVDPLLVDMTMTSDITSAFDDAFSEYYSAKTTVQSETSNLNNIKLELSSNTSLITVSSRGELRTEEIIFSVNTQGIADLSSIQWKLSYEENIGDGLDYVYLSESVIDYSKRVLNCNTVFVDNFTLSVTYTVGTRTYSDSLAISKVIDGSALPAYQNASATVPVITSEGALIRDDFFLYVGPYLGNGTAPTEEYLEKYRKDGKLTEVPAAVNNEFIYGRLYKYVGQESATCTVGQTASNSIIISNEDALVYVTGLTVYLNSEAERRTITGISTYDASNKEVSLSGAAFNTTTDSLVYIDVWGESRDSKHLSDASADALEIARNSGVWMYCAVLVAQLGLFGELLIEDKIESTNYEEYDADVIDTEPTSPTYGQVIHTKGEPKTGFKLDGKNNEIKAYAMKAYDSTFYGTVESSGFKTLTGTGPIIISAVSIPKALWKYSDMFELVLDQDYLYNISGTIEGFSFDKAVRRTNKRIKLAEHGYESESISANENHAFTKLTFTPAFGNSFYVEYSGYYEGFASSRMFSILAEPNEISKQSEFLPTSYTVAKIYTLPVPSTTGYSSVINHHSTAAWGEKSSYVSYHRVYSSRAFNGLVLVNGISSYKVIEPKSNAYYPNTIIWNIGANNQNTLSNYVSGTEFYNKFYKLPTIADGYVANGKIKIKNIGQPLTEYTVTRLVKDGNGISFYTNSGIVRVDKFNEGTSSGVYEHLEITQDIEFKTVPDGIEVKSVLPWGTFSGIDTNVSIGTSDSRFDSGYFDALDVTNDLMVGGTLSVPNRINLGGREMYACRAWVNFNGATSPISIRGAGNVDSITDNGTGNYTINFTTNMPDTNYAVSGMGMEASGTSSGTTFQSAISFASLSDIKIGSVRILNANIDSDTNVDGVCITVAIFR